MKKNTNLIEFNLTDVMAVELLKFNEVKKELVKLNKKNILTEEELKKRKKLEKDLSDIRVRFIKEFRKNNKKEINMYLEKKDQF